MVLLETLTILSSLVGLGGRRKANIDTFIFKLHYRFTCCAIFALSLTLSARELIGSNIECYGTNRNEDFEKFVKSYCFATGTQTVKKYEAGIHGSKLTPKRQDYNMATISPNLGHHVAGRDELRHHTYYLWVPFVLLCSGASFRLTRQLWKSLEGGKIAALLKKHGDRRLRLGQKEADKNTSTALLASYLRRSRGSCHNFYLAGYFVCEVLNVAVVLANIFAFDAFLGKGNFLGLGKEYVNYERQDPAEVDRVDHPLLKYFPRVTKCQIWKYGPSGTLENADFICVLASNILTEKIFIFLWFWFIVLLIMSAAALLRWFFLIPVQSRRSWLTSKGKWAKPGSLNLVLKNIGFADFFLLTRLSKNMSGEAFGKLIDRMAKEIEHPPVETANTKTGNTVGEKPDRLLQQHGGTGPTSSSDVRHRQHQQATQPSAERTRDDDTSGDDSSFDNEETLRMSPPMLLHGPVPTISGRFLAGGPAGPSKNGVGAEQRGGPPPLATAWLLTPSGTISGPARGKKHAAVSFGMKPT